MACELGEGAYAKVYCGVDENKHKFALKVVNETNVWELYISEQIKKRLKNESLVCLYSFILIAFITIINFVIYIFISNLIKAGKSISVHNDG